MKDMRSVRFNEKVKRFSTVLGAGGIALLIATLLRWSDRDFDLAIGAWILMSVVLIYVSVQMNDLLESEEAE
ncbi:hypothetical protein GCM10007897_41580 [Sphingobium jiangsuense]|uniref:Uncharacterized protein n=1 Tax=Sphingobium jiangsuense TaxID=870476 RepID=A0A7W6BRN6_9SPHN|nr:hypothetical protein [Sphingobium jiangsuense]MBB3928825.1 hypothetical protein [Sphingobium jiangsuense]GLT02736.1 hypothetical protein GCM10007897_41580 [Sphingobium jiangsuense]